MGPEPRYEAKAYRPADKLSGCKALVTGGDSGIGRAVAVLFAREGADVAIVYLAEEERLLLHVTLRAGSHAAWQLDHQYRINHGAGRKPGASRLLGNERRNTQLHQIPGKNLVDRGIRVNCVAPGPVWTPLNPAERPANDMENFGSGMPMGRPAQPEEIAPAYVFFASSADSGYISGEVLPILGGETIAG